MGGAARAARGVQGGARRLQRAAGLGRGPAARQLGQGAAKAQAEPRPRSAKVTSAHRAGRDGMQPLLAPIPHRFTHSELSSRDTDSVSCAVQAADRPEGRQASQTAHQGVPAKTPENIVTMYTTRSSLFSFAQPFTISSSIINIYIKINEK